MTAKPSISELIVVPLTVFVLLSLAGCAGAPATATSAKEPTETVARTEPAKSTTDTDSSSTASPSTRLPGIDSPRSDSPTMTSSVLDELSVDDALGFNPPAPANVRAGSVTQSSAELLWDAPLPVLVPHSYSDNVVEYRIYRGEQDDIELRPYGTSSGLGFVDKSVQSGRTYNYSVSSIREMNVEGTRSYPYVTITVR